MVFQHVFVAQRIHGLPESVVTIRRQPAILRKALERLAFPHRVVAADVFDDARFEHEKAAIDPGAVAFRLFLVRSMRS